MTATPNVALPAVTILIPTYNRQDLLGQAIASAQGQTYAGKLEIVVLDDHSSDDTTGVVRSFLADPRVRYVQHLSNLGIAENWRIGLGLVTGEFFCILHDDDTYEPTFVERLVAPLAADPGLVLTFCDHWVMSADGRRLLTESDAASAQFGRVRLPGGTVANFARTALLDLAVPVGAAVLRRSAVIPEMIDPAAKGAIDMWLLYQCVRTGGGAVYVEERLMNYRLHPGSMSGGMPLQMAPGHVHRLTVALADPMMRQLWPNFRRQMGQAREGHGVALMAAGRFSAARAELLRAVVKRPTSRGTVMLVAACFGRPGQFFVRAARRVKHLIRQG